MTFISNPQIELAFDYVRNTNKNIFLTGKAGTGKTTFLHQVKAENTKRTVVVAPTGVAAINAGGMTIHSFFQLPFGPQIPNAPNSQSRQRKMKSSKINLIKSLDLLIIDEISMVRADLLDGIDQVLRRYRRSVEPFGGVQLLMIGDLHQLPPVVKNEEWRLLRDHYSTPYFFGSQALQQTGIVTIQLKKIYRQSDSQFIDLLNKVRTNQMDTDVLQTLNSRYRATLPDDKEDYITLSAHNATANSINARKLAALDAQLHRFKAEVQGDFPEHAYPTAKTLELKKGAQVLFIKNDISPEKRYFNGKIGRITDIRNDEIIVKCKDDADTISVKKSDWENVKYNLDATTKEVTENVVGTFTQYPLKLAWAITIHKSQGLTFERVIIDAQHAFAHGQTYVALSRCKRFEGIILRTRIDYTSVKTDSVVQNYTNDAEKNTPGQAQLNEAKRSYQQSVVKELFDFKFIKRPLALLHRLLLENNLVVTEADLEQFETLRGQLSNNVFAPAQKFTAHLDGYFAEADMPEENPKLQERLQKAGVYFSEKLKPATAAFKNISIISQNEGVRKKTREQLDQLIKELNRKTACFTTCLNGFSIQTYLRAKTNADLLKETSSPQKKSSASSWTNMANDTAHPELMLQLLRWRSDTAADLDLPSYRIASNRTLFELVKLLPTQVKTLKRVKGIGASKAKQFGDELLRIIKQYVSENQISADLPVEDQPEDPLNPSSKYISLTLFNDGNTIDQVAATRGLAASTVRGHLSYYIARGQLEATKLIDPKKLFHMESFFLEEQTTSLKEAKLHFNDQYSYDELQLALAHVKATR